MADEVRRWHIARMQRGDDTGPNAIELVETMNRPGFTDRTEKVLGYAREEAALRGASGLRTEHILLALVREWDGVAATTLEKLRVDRARLRSSVEAGMPPRSSSVEIGAAPPNQPDATQAIEYAVRAAVSLGHGYVGTEHLLLGILEASDGRAAGVLASLGATHEKALKMVRHILDDEPM